MKLTMFILLSVMTTYTFAQTKKVTELEQIQSKVKADITVTAASTIATGLSIHGFVQKNAEAKELISSSDSKVRLGQVEHLPETEIKIENTLKQKNRYLAGSFFSAALTLYFSLKTYSDYQSEREIKAKDVSFIHQDERKVEAKVVDSKTSAKTFSCEEQ
ncbi:MAG: hypothetical protein JNM93_06685 [Bacteriovoracaceae bacterium]|nr:hypothetical protein [Bacteriovoracaceae bacterium]